MGLDKARHFSLTLQEGSAEDIEVEAASQRRVECIEAVRRTVETLHRQNGCVQGGGCRLVAQVAGIEQAEIFDQIDSFLIGRTHIGVIRAVRDRREGGELLCVSHGAVAVAVARCRICDIGEIRFRDLAAELSHLAQQLDAAVAGGGGKQVVGRRLNEASFAGQRAVDRLGRARVQESLQAVGGGHHRIQHRGGSR